jgi:hypothetical protein
MSRKRSCHRSHGGHGRSSARPADGGSRVARGNGELTPSDATLVTDVCGPFLVQTKGGTAPIGAVVNVEVVGVTPVQFCQPAAGVNPVLIDRATGDLGDGTDGTVGGEAIAVASSLPDEGDFTFGILSSGSGSFDITVFVEEPGGPNDNDDPTWASLPTAPRRPSGQVAEVAEVAEATSDRTSRSRAGSAERSDRRIPLAWRVGRSSSRRSGEDAIGSSAVTSALGRAPIASAPRT